MNVMGLDVGEQLSYKVWERSQTNNYCPTHPLSLSLSLSLRPDTEYFRVSTEGDCGRVVRCDKAGSVGEIRLAELKCPQGLAFDLHLQTCDWKANVKAWMSYKTNRRFTCGKATQVHGQTLYSPIKWPEV